MPAAPPTPARPAHEAVAALRNAFQLGGSLLVTWAIALGVRILLPRWLGPEQFGILNFADGFAAVALLGLGLGLETYVRKEIPVRPDHAGDFFGGVVALRLLLSVATFAAVGLVLEATGRPPEVRRVVFVFAAAQVFLAHNATLAALLQAQGSVGGLSVVQVVAKLLWAGGILLALAFRGGLVGIGAVLLATEAAKSVALWGLARRHLGLRLHLRARATWAVLSACLPYFLDSVAVNAYARLGVSALQFILGSAEEVGWYGAAANLAAVALMMAPLITWVLTPLLARAVARSEAELDAALRRAVELVLVLAVPISLMGVLGADVVVGLLFGEAFAPAAWSLRILAAALPLTYLAMIFATALVLLRRAWTLTLISAAGLVLNVALSLLLIEPWAALGPGGGGAGCALAAAATEVLVTGLMLLVLGRRCLDGRVMGMLARSALGCAAAALVHRVAAPLGPARLVLDALCYAGLVLALDKARLVEMARFLAASLRKPRGALGVAPD